MTVLILIVSMDCCISLHAILLKLYMRLPECLAEYFVTMLIDNRHVYERSYIISYS